MDVRKPTPLEIEEEKDALIEMSKDVPLVKYRKRKAVDVDLE